MVGLCFACLLFQTIFLVIMERHVQNPREDNEYQNINNEHSDLRPQNDQDDEDPIRHRYTLYAKVADYQKLVKVSNLLLVNFSFKNRMNVLFVVKI